MKFSKETPQLFDFLLRNFSPNRVIWLCSIIAEKSGQSYDKVFADMDRDYWMTSAEAREYGMIDKILGK